MGIITESDYDIITVKHPNIIRLKSMAHSNILLLNRGRYNFKYSQKLKI